MEAAESQVEESVGERYRVLSLLGRGGMGAVYRVCDQYDGRELALKRLMLPKGHERTAAELFEREFHTLSELAHPRIIEVYDYGVDTEGAYYTMELLPGQDLRELGKTDWQTACRLLRDVASSLAILHSRKLLHCDVSPRNVRCTADGRAKLLDFGAMAAMGVTRRVLGTPPFIAPEMVQLQSLDARADLYGLGALGYWMLTGRFAYPARSISDLRDLWHTPPRSPSELEPSIPVALSELLLDCLRINRNARPNSAGVVMERLCAIASLPLDEQIDVAQAYLTMPTLVGRGQHVNAVRGLLANREKGGVIALSGAAGCGRSRLLDAFVLEAKLLGWQAIRTNAGDAAHGPYGVVRSLCEQLYAIAPEVSRSAARLHAPVLAHVLGPALVQHEASGEPPARDHVLLSLRDFVLSVSRALRLFIAVDDVDRIDETSTSLLAALAQKARRRPLTIAFAADSAAAGSAALDLLMDTAQRIDLAPLTEAETESLVHSLFGTATHTLVLARRLHALSRGNPRAIMQLAQHLVQQGIARYQAGSFVLPEKLRDEDLPRSLVAALEGRMASLEQDALEVARALALTEPSELPASSYVELTAHRDRARAFRALDQLVRAEILEVEGERYRMSNASWREVLRGGLDAATQKELHARLARAFESHGTVPRVAYHLMESAQPEAAIRVLLAQFIQDPTEPRDPLEDQGPAMLDLLERAAYAGVELHVAGPLRIELFMKTAGGSQFMGDLARFLRVAPPVLAQLKRESGLDDYAALDPSMEPMARLTAALTQTQQRYDATPESERGLAPIDAIREVARMCAMYTGIGAASMDVGIFEGLPSLEPLVPLSPAIYVMHLFVISCHALMQGRFELALELLDKMLARLEQPDRAGVGELYHRSMRLGSRLMIAVVKAGAGVPDAAALLPELERQPGHRVNAQRVHMVCHMMQANLEEATAAQRRVELAMLQDGHRQRGPGTTARLELFAYAMMDDLSGVKEVTERLAKGTAAFPLWSALVHLGQCHHRRLQGDLAGALEVLGPALEQAKPTRYRDWTWIAAAHVQVLAGLGRCDEAVERGLAYLEICERERLHPGSRIVATATAAALTAAKRADEAAAMLDRLVTEASTAGVRGLILGSLYEHSARAAIARANADDFRRFAELCADEYRADRTPMLAAKYERLLREAEVAGVIGSAAPMQIVPIANEVTSGSAFSTVMRSRLLECPDAATRARCALTMIAETMQSSQAFLYGLREAKLVFLCGQPEVAPPPGLEAAVNRHLQNELEAEGKTVVAEISGPAGGAPNILGGNGDVPATGMQSTALVQDDQGGFYPLLLMTKSDDKPVIAAVAVLHFRNGLRRMPSAHLLEALANTLLEFDDLDPLTCLA